MAPGTTGYTSASLPRGRDAERILSKLLERLRYQRLSDTSLQLGNRIFSEAGDEPEPVSLTEVESISELFGKSGLKGRVTFTAEDIFVRNRVEPLQAMLSQWMAGAVAQVGEENIPFSDIITWCQDSGSLEERRVLAREARTLCRFLAPFSHATWQALTATVTEELEYENYMAFCQTRRTRPFGQEALLCSRCLDSDRSGYMKRVRKWLHKVHPGMALSEANRFDAIYLLGMRYMDPLSKGVISQDTALDFFSSLGVNEDAGLQIHFQGRSGRQSYCVPVAIPGEVHVIVGPVSGWLDWEALFHELGHAFSFLHTSGDIPVEAREFFVSGAVSEAFAFLFQRMCMKKNFLEQITGAEGYDLYEVEKLHGLKLEVLTRRYGAKFLIEYENFKNNRISGGQELYASIMEKETGFSYDPETYLFDLMPDFYSLDYFLAFTASEVMLKHLEKNFGESWFSEETAMETLKAWAAVGSLHEIHEFMKKMVGIGLS